MNDQIADVLADTAEYIEKNGWWKGALLGPNGNQACVIGAMLYSQGLDNSQVENPLVRNTAESLLGVIQFPNDCYRFHHAVGAVECWNDHKTTTKQIVLDTLRKAEKVERAGFDPDAA